MKGQAQLFLIVFVLIVLALVSAVIILNYNGLVKADKSVEEQWGQIEVACQRRLDLIPNLVETVKGYAQHESQTLKAITEMRSKAMGQLQQAGDKKDRSNPNVEAINQSQENLSQALSGLWLEVENYPALRAASNFLALQDQLEGSENRIAVARQRYNTAVRYYNSKIETFPGVFLAPLFGFEKRDFIAAKVAAREPAKVSF